MARFEEEPRRYCPALESILNRKLRMMPRVGKGLIGTVVMITLAALCVSGP